MFTLSRKQTAVSNNGIHINNNGQISGTLDMDLTQRNTKLGIKSNKYVQNRQNKFIG